MSLLSARKVRVLKRIKRGGYVGELDNISGAIDDIKDLVDTGYLRFDDDSTSVVEITTKGDEYLNQLENVINTEPGTGAPISLSGGPYGMLMELREERYSITEDETEERSWYIDYFLKCGFAEHVDDDIIEITNKGKAYLKLREPESNYEPKETIDDESDNNPYIEFDQQQNKAIKLIHELIGDGIFFSAPIEPGVGKAHDIGKANKQVLWLIKRKYLYFTDLGKLKFQNKGLLLVNKAIEDVGIMIENSINDTE